VIRPVRHTRRLRRRRIDRLPDNRREEPFGSLAAGGGQSTS
jgi:hypothetical protein